MSFSLFIFYYFYLLCFRKSVKLVMFQEHLLTDIKIETIMANVSHWLLKTDVYIKCFASISDAKIKLALNTKKSILNKRQNCCNDICNQNEIQTKIELYVPKVILYKQLKK